MSGSFLQTHLNEALTLRNVMMMHAIFCGIYGLFIVVLPHGFYVSTGSYNYLYHESSRLYGCLTLGIGWLVWSTKSIKDGRVMRAVSEAFAVSFLLQSVVMLRAFFTNAKETNHLVHILVALSFLAIGVLYSYARFAAKHRDFELPGLD
jgi:hypothetical protein